MRAVRNFGSFYRFADSQHSSSFVCIHVAVLPLWSLASSGAFPALSIFFVQLKAILRRVGCTSLLLVGSYS
jgi:hypothetical protein